MPEAVYRDNANRFSVYRLADIPDGVPRSGWATIERWRDPDSFAVRSDYIARFGRAAYLETFLTMREFGGPGGVEKLCAVADEHAGPLLRGTRVDRATMRCRPHSALCCQICMVADVLDERATQPTDIDFHREATKHLGAQHGERHGWRPMPESASAAWSAHLRLLVEQSAQQDRAREDARVGWDPYGDDL